MYQAINEPDISHIFGGIYVGNQAAALNVKLLTELNIRRIVRLRTQPLQSFPPSICYTAFCPFEDLPDSDIHNIMPNVFQNIRHSLAVGERCLVHCFAGKSRSPAIVIAFLMLDMNIPLKIAYNHVDRARSGLNMNPSFKHQLSVLEYLVMHRNSLRYCHFCGDFDCSCLQFQISHCIFCSSIRTSLRDIILLRLINTVGTQTEPEGFLNQSNRQQLRSTKPAYRLSDNDKSRVTYLSRKAEKASMVSWERAKLVEAATVLSGLFIGDLLSKAVLSSLFSSSTLSRTGLHRRKKMKKKKLKYDERMDGQSSHNKRIITPPTIPRPNPIPKRIQSQLSPLSRPSDITQVQTTPVLLIHNTPKQYSSSPSHNSTDPPSSSSAKLTPQSVSVKEDKGLSTQNMLPVPPNSYFNPFLDFDPTTKLFRRFGVTPPASFLCPLSAALLTRSLPFRYQQVFPLYTRVNYDPNLRIPVQITPESSLLHATPSIQPNTHTPSQVVQFASRTHTNSPSKQSNDSSKFTPLVRSMSSPSICMTELCNTSDNSPNEALNDVVVFNNYTALTAFILTQNASAAATGNHHINHAQPTESTSDIPADILHYFSFVFASMRNVCEQNATKIGTVQNTSLKPSPPLDANASKSESGTQTTEAPHTGDTPSTDPKPDEDNSESSWFWESYSESIEARDNFHELLGEQIVTKVERMKRRKMYVNELMKTNMWQKTRRAETLKTDRIQPKPAQKTQGRDTDRLKRPESFFDRDQPLLPPADPVISPVMTHDSSPAPVGNSDSDHYSDFSETSFGSLSETGQSEEGAVYRKMMERQYKTPVVWMENRRGGIREERKERDAKRRGSFSFSTFLPPLVASAPSLLPSSSLIHPQPPPKDTNSNELSEGTGKKRKKYESVRVVLVQDSMEGG
ncbi:putative Dual specificity phosphatase, catalytic domain containing protein [Blattamonas nauphoetae]|uniref:protein-tyrosine-phosphatase n=1 Tax=Blattamonas nauphoetae TaxID=2049346 RepID=A0ABQ9YMD2_9EUKA|nr:putative Dual specificity phosphatase, catalytic domain containing protein [Blattamonas nauphoetae]